ncbi:D-Ala-D-Ala carboxypeptidase family metallohydrolase [Streptomyces sp. PT12]|uniref:D-Ala-D-Ala carboxypeptidase family metallohydrolase n=1 Tax=Streptomyces sp. PT12 TaxID=1510197 RepID=UPI000DE31578|nr:D-Ala-D-Ala carboxypeptidase family metallohydrolase [Streptomyces sp. PT12]RBM23238.1 peptidase M15 [Streptomyces sp. PT12]
MLRRALRVLLAIVMISSAAVVSTVATAGTAYADGCYTWNRTLRQGSTGEDVRQLQIRVSGYPGYGAVLALDGVYGPATAAAVTRFQQAYGLSADGIAGPQTFGKIYDLQDNDCTPVHFTWGELNRCNSNWSGGQVSASQARANALVSMWKLEALRHALGDRAIVTSSGFRSVSCNNAAGGSPTSRHMYGDAVDLVGTPSFCQLSQQARYHGFNEILGPGYPGHNDHVHLAHRSSRYWSAPSCGI